MCAYVSVQRVRCQPQICVDDVTLVNVERYSSHVKEFKLLGSQKYPVRAYGGTAMGGRALTRAFVDDRPPSGSY